MKYRFKENISSIHNAMRGEKNQKNRRVGALPLPALREINEPFISIH